jgi:sulfate transport system ATP-binding protein
MTIEALHITKRFGGHYALNDVNLRIEHGELVALLGPSGGGKTTLLRILAGMEVPDSGEVRFSDADVTGTGPSARGVGFVFQHYALFREMTVFENVAFGLRVKPKKERPDENAIQKRVNELVELVQLEGLAGRYPDQLSGGQRQRVALARALAVQPKVLLLDEPFGALDAKVRRELRAWLRRLHDELHVTSVLVTHDQEEAFEVADRVVVIHEGKLHQNGTPEELLLSPESDFVREFLGEARLVDARVGDDGSIVIDPMALPTTSAPGTQVRVSVRGARVVERPSRP